jgi:hypothetical protein
MKRISILNTAACVGGLAIACTFQFGCKKAAASDSGEVVATVNKSPITEDEYLRYLVLKPAVRIRTPQGILSMPVAESIGIQALNDVVKQKLLVELAKEEGLYPNEDDIEKELGFREKREPGFAKRLSSQGFSMALIKEALALNMAEFRLVTKGVTITPAQVDEYIKKNPKEFTEPATVDLLWVFVRTPASQKRVDAELKKAQPFDEVATRYSEANNVREMKGKFPVHNVEQLPKPIRDMVMKTPELKTTNWIHAQDGYAKFYVLAKTPARPVKIADTVREVERRNLATRRGEQINNLEARILSKMRNSDIKVQFAGLKEPYERAVAELKATGKAPDMPQVAASPGEAPPLATGKGDAMPKIDVNAVEAPSAVQGKAPGTMPSVQGKASEVPSALTKGG